MSFMPIEPLVAGDDREHRDRRLLRAKVWSQACGEQDALIRNVSRYGLGGSVSNAPLASGMDVTVTLLTGFQVRGTVRWTRGDLFGMRLHEAVNPDTVVSEMRKQLDLKRSTGEWEVHARHRLPQQRPAGPIRRL